jgi:hypothetical protein
LGLQIANPPSATFAEYQQILQVSEVLKFVDLRFAVLICGLPTHLRKIPKNFKNLNYFNGKMLLLLFTWVLFL